MNAINPRFARMTLPDDHEVELAKEASRKLSAVTGGKVDLHLEVEEGHVSVTLPAAAMQMFVDLLTHMSQGNAVTIIPVNAELTTQQAADLLNVSRPYLIKLIEKEKVLPCTKVGRHRRIKYQDLVEYKRQVDAERMKALDELTDLSQELDMGY